MAVYERSMRATRKSWVEYSNGSGFSASKGGSVGEEWILPDMDISDNITR